MRHNAALHKPPNGSAQAQSMAASRELMELSLASRELMALSPRAREIYFQLKAAVEKNQENKNK
jgi:hypothetical protein